MNQKHHHQHETTTDTRPKFQRPKRQIRGIRAPSPQPP